MGSNPTLSEFEAAGAPAPGGFVFGRDSKPTAARPGSNKLLVNITLFYLVPIAQTSLGPPVTFLRPFGLWPVPGLLATMGP